MASTFSPDPIPLPPSPPPPPPQPLPEPSPNFAFRRGDQAPSAKRQLQRRSAMYRAAFSDFNLLRVTEHAFWLLASHGISSSGAFPPVCAACRQPWRCQQVIWAAGWILRARRLGLLAEFGLELSDDILALLATWGADADVAGAHG